jgi:hypothetical protein
VADSCEHNNESSGSIRGLTRRVTISFLMAVPHSQVVSYQPISFSDVNALLQQSTLFTC